MLEAHRGAGDDEVDFDGEFPAAVIAARHTGSGKFQVREVLGRAVINEIGAYDGTNRLSGPIFGLEIKADGAWTWAVLYTCCCSLMYRRRHGRGRCRPAAS